MKKFVLIVFVFVSTFIWYDFQIGGANQTTISDKGSNLKPTNLTRADLTGANLAGVNLYGVILCNTIMPDETINNSSCQN